MNESIDEDGGRRWFGLFWFDHGAKKLVDHYDDDDDGGRC